MAGDGRPIESSGIRMRNLAKVRYVILFGWPRMGLPARIRWVKELRKVCIQIETDCDDYLERHDRP